MASRAEHRDAITRLFYPAELPADGGSFGIRVNVRACDAGSQEELVLGVVLIGQAFRRTTILPSESYKSLTLDGLVCPPDGVTVNVNMTSDAGCFVVRDAVITQ